MKRKDFIKTTAAVASAAVLLPHLVEAKVPFDDSAVSKSFAAKLLNYDRTTKAESRYGIPRYSKAPDDFATMWAKENASGPDVVIEGRDFLLPLPFDASYPHLDRKALALIEEAARNRPYNGKYPLKNKLSPELEIELFKPYPAGLHLINQAFTQIEKHRLVVEKVLVAKNLQSKFETAFHPDTLLNISDNFSDVNPSDIYDDFSGFPTTITDEDKPWVLLWCSEVYLRSDIKDNMIYFLASPKDIGILTHYTDTQKVGMVVVNPRGVYGVEVV
jgi:hypothetical protein